MFHTYVQNAAKKMVDIDRASYLMDKGLYAQSKADMAKEREEDPRHDAVYDAQWVWDYYCQRHVEKYGAYFEPDVDPNWDQ